MGRKETEKGCHGCPWKTTELISQKNSQKQNLQKWGVYSDETLCLQQWKQDTGDRGRKTPSPVMVCSNRRKKVEHGVTDKSIISYWLQVIETIINN